MKKIFLAIAVVLLFATCKKDSSSTSTTPPVTPLNATGTWALASDDNTFFSVGRVSAAQYPCISGNVLILKSDSTYSSSYTGTDTCYVSASHAIGSDVIIGIPGTAAETGTWHRNGNDIYIGSHQYAIAELNGSLVLNLNYTFTINSTNFGVTAVYTKQ